MTTSIRPAGPNDIDEMADLLLSDAEARCRADPQLWKLDDSPREKILSAVQASIGAGEERWLLAQVGDAVVGLTHATIVPVPPIYDGKFGAPGLLMEDCFVSPDAPLSTRSDLLRVAEADLVKAGARMVIASSAAGGDWEDEYARSGYQPVTGSSPGLNFTIGLSGERRASAAARAMLPGNAVVKARSDTQKRRAAADIFRERPAMPSSEVRRGAAIRLEGE